MEIKSLTPQLVPQFVDYCKTYGPLQDESFIPDASYRLDKSERAFLLLDDGEVKGAVCLFLAGRVPGRFRIFHCREAVFEHYQALFDRVRPYENDVPKFFFFSPQDNVAVRDIALRLGFELARYNWLMERDSAAEPPTWPAGFAVKPVREGRDEPGWCEVLNRSFAPVYPDRIDLSPAGLRDEMHTADVIPGGVMALFDHDHIVGTLFVSVAEPGTAEIGSVSVQEEYRGRGLGRQLLRHAIQFARERGFEKVCLSVAADNAHATALYESEGFKSVLSVVRYERYVTR
jgi:mycothiol synthase